MFTWPFSDRGRLQAARTILERVAAAVDSGVCAQLWDGSVVPLGRNADPNLRFIVHTPGVIASLLRWPTLDNLVHHFALGRIELRGADLTTFWEKARGQGSKEARRRLKPLGLLPSLLPFLFHPSDRSRVQHAVAEDTSRQTSGKDYKKLVEFHYDLSNEFYELFLDPEMQYTCGYYSDWKNSLAQAQLDKLEMICRKLRLQPGETLLDVGCGWGGLLCYAARNYGVRGHGVTLSSRQLAYCQEKIRKLGLEGRVTVELRDMYDLQGTFDKIACVGIMEHAGIAHYPAYFRKLSSLLSDRGILLNQAIMRGAKAARGRFRRRRPEHRFILKYIFPGADLGHVGNVLEVMEQNNFLIHDVEGWREHYALTCKAWCRNLYDNRQTAERLVGAETVRLWEAYMAGFSHCFHKGSLRLFQVVAAKRAGVGSPVLPASRNDLYALPFPSQVVSTAERAA